MYGLILNSYISDTMFSWAVLIDTSFLILVVAVSGRHPLDVSVDMLIQRQFKGLWIKANEISHYLLLILYLVRDIFILRLYVS